MGVRDPLGWIGSTFASKYRIDAFAGEGGFGTVYRGKHLTLGKPIAVKFLKPERAPPDQQKRFLKRFLAEGRLLHDLSRATAGVVQVLDLGAETSPAGEWLPYIVMEWIEGRTLADELDARPRRSVSEAVALLDPVLDALAVAHEMGIVHRDLKPANLMLCRIGGRDTIKVLDFGIAKVMGDSRDASTAVTDVDGLRAFSPAYAAPEQFEAGRGPTGPWTDVYALALILIEVVDGVRAHQGGHEDCRTRALDLEHRPALARDRSVDTVLRKALAVDRRNRYASAAELREAFHALVPRANAPTPRPSAPSSPSTTTSAVTAEAPPPRPAPGRRVRRRFLVLVAFAALLGLLLLALGGEGDGPAASQPGNDARMEPVDPTMLRVDPPTGATPFYLQAHEVTVADYTACVAARACPPTTAKITVEAGLPDCNEFVPAARARHPINCAALEDARQYCTWKRMRLPTQAEWTIAAGPSRTYSMRGATDCADFVFARGKGYPGGCKGVEGTEPVDAQRAKGPFGHQDLIGNVHEWTITSEGGGAQLGGGWDTPPVGLRKVNNWGPGPSAGFRCARDAR